MVMKVIAHGGDRAQAIQRLDAALSQLRIEGIAHNAPYLRACLKHPEFVQGAVHTGLLTQHHEALLQGAGTQTGMRTDALAAAAGSA
jgi:acetyl/propionyl-CoA carboxylase alpha subunit